MSRIRKTIAKNYVNFRGWQTNHKFVVVESDDWGSIRMPSLDIVESLKTKYPLVNNKFTLLDGLEKTDDLIELFNLLKVHQDNNGNHPVITACCLVANPDFIKIQSNYFREYYYESIEQTYKAYGDKELLSLWLKEGILKNLLFPQFHGREHLNPQKWLNVLRSNNAMELEAFNSRALLGLSDSLTANKDLYMAAFEASNEKEEVLVKEATVDGLNLFQEIFGFKSISFVPSQSKQFERISETLVDNGVRFSQAGQHFISLGNGKFKKNDRFWGDKDKYGITYWRRNCNFEPYRGDKKAIDNCLSEIEIAFRWGKPAVISSHRINFTSRIDKDHRDRCLEQFDSLFFNILRKWPEVQFISSAQLAEIMLKSKS
ncbi:MAG: hypothetical protein ACXIUD_11070 [Mongoliitalea sp.]